MHRIDGPGATSDGRFVEGDSTTGQPSTVVTDDWANAVQEELVNAIALGGEAPYKPDNGQLARAITKLLKTRLPAGAVQGFMLTSAPAGWLACDGSVVSRTTYADLFTAIGTRFGAGDGATTFGLPDLRGEFLRGLDGGRGVDPGRVLGSAQADELRSHTHTLNPAIALEDGGTGGPGGSTSGTASLIGPTGATGGAETRPRNVAVLYCIRA